MLKIFFIAGLLFAASNCFSQSVTPVPEVKTDYLKKSKKQKTAAWILLGAGAVLTGAGLAVANQEITDDFTSIFAGEEPKWSSTGTVLFYTGVATMLGSVPLFVISSSNKKKAEAMSASLKIETMSGFQKNNFTARSYPALSLKFRL